MPGIVVMLRGLLFKNTRIRRNSSINLPYRRMAVTHSVPLETLSADEANVTMSKHTIFIPVPDMGTKSVQASPGACETTKIQPNR
jgi:hypothetical protein